MSMFHGGDDDRILLEEIVETSEEQEEFCCKSEIVDELCLLSAEGVDEKQQKSQKDISATAAACRNNVLLNGAAGSVSRDSSHGHMEQERRMRREIANSNERRRMQSINAGFQSLRTLLPHHEGEKLSKAAILQQTAEYIYQLEQEKTQLLSQNCQLKRLINQHEGGDVPIKKRKTENQGVVVGIPPTAQHLNDDEGLGSMSPEPLSAVTAAALITVDHPHSSSNEIIELRRQLERERQARHHLEKQLRTIQNQSMFTTAATTTTDRFRVDNQLIAYQPHEVIEHTDNLMQVETEEQEEEEEEEVEEEEEEEETTEIASLQVVSLVSLPPVGSTQTVETTIPELSSPPLSPQPVEVVAEEIKEEEEVEDEEEEEEEEEVEELVEDSETSIPKTVTFTSQIFPSVAVEEQQQQQTECAFSPSHVTSYGCTESTSNSSQYITGSPTRPYSPEEDIQQRLPSVLEAAMKAEPKVEVERLPSPASSLDDGTPQARLYLANTSRQNLETIVEAIRHLEGDHLFSDEPAQDVPLALTNKPLTTTTASSKQRLVTNFLQFQQQQQAQQRPGVIVVKHS
ncbi:apoptotic chromatin condensation inducer in the nucleus [Leptopilina boulardi]|uniref:apoptotic chromatin condensation inducer in the nucleus n=1 Tax=Leptopilina boulardi TaxID=63433 RepID=UPI0021F54F26|nr:apoptotic chromatin condensation inducer in the nucleus [Leptopilina boulardi]